MGPTLVRVLFALLVVCILMFVVLPFVGATLMSLVWALLVGLVLGFIARMIAPGRGGRMGWLMTSLIGVAGGLIGTAVANALDTGDFGSVLLQIAAAVVLVIALRPSADHA